MSGLLRNPLVLIFIGFVVSASACEGCGDVNEFVSEYPLTCGLMVDPAVRDAVGDHFGIAKANIGHMERADLTADEVFGAEFGEYETLDYITEEEWQSCKDGWPTYRRYREEGFNLGPRRPIDLDSALAEREPPTTTTTTTTTEPVHDLDDVVEITVSPDDLINIPRTPPPENVSNVPTGTSTHRELADPPVRRPQHPEPRVPNRESSGEPATTTTTTSTTPATTTTTTTSTTVPPVCNPPSEVPSSGMIDWTDCAPFTITSTCTNSDGLQEISGTVDPALAGRTISAVYVAVADPPDPIPYNTSTGIVDSHGNFQVELVDLNWDVADFAEYSLASLHVGLDVGTASIPSSQVDGQLVISRFDLASC